MEINKGKIKEFKILEVATDSRAVDEDEEEHSLVQEKVRTNSFRI